MTLDLPKPVVAYFTADKCDSEAVAGSGRHQAMEGGSLGQVSIHHRAACLRAEGWQVHRHQQGHR